MQSPSLQDYTRLNAAVSNDCYWLNEFLSDGTGSTYRHNPYYLVRLIYKVSKNNQNATLTMDFGTGPDEMSRLEHFLNSSNVSAIIVCHRDSSRVDPEILAILWRRFSIPVSFMRQHFDYKEYRDEVDCSKTIRDELKHEHDMIENTWELGGRWNPIRLPSESRDLGLRLYVASECLSVIQAADTTIALVRSKGVYIFPQPFNKKFAECAIDLYAATKDTVSLSIGALEDSSQLSDSIVHFYARLLVLRCYEDHYLRHDVQPVVKIGDSDRVVLSPYIEAMHRRRLEVVKLKIDLQGYLGPSTRSSQMEVVQNGPNPAKLLSRQRIQDLISDIQDLLSLHDSNMKVYEWSIQLTSSEYRQQLASEQLEEAAQSKTTAISLGKLSNVAFLYLPLNFVCAMLGMNLEILGQGTTPVWTFLLLAIGISSITYFPIFRPQMTKQQSDILKITYHLAKRSFRAGFWFLMFCVTHDSGQNWEIINSGLAQTFLGHTNTRSKGWVEGSNDEKFRKAALGSQEFWREKVKEIVLVLEEPTTSSRASDRNV